MSGSGQVLDEAMDVIDRLRQGDRVKKHEEIYYSVFECRLHILQSTPLDTQTTWRSQCQSSTT